MHGTSFHSHHPHPLFLVCSLAGACLRARDPVFCGSSEETSGSSAVPQAHGGSFSWRNGPRDLKMRGHPHHEIAGNLWSCATGDLPVGHIVMTR